MTSPKKAAARARRDADLEAALEAMAADPNLGDEGQRIAAMQLRRLRTRHGTAPTTDPKETSQ